MKRARRALAGLLCGSLALAAGLDRLLPLPDPAARLRYATVVTAEDGTPLSAFPDPQGVWRYPIGLEQVSPAYIEALLGYEDRWYWQHPGINPLALGRAAWQNLSAGRVISGGSTLSMQVVRLLDPHPRTLSGKLCQLLRTLQLEWHLDKRQILTLYLNLAPFGGPLEGVQAASYGYFGKPAERLSDAEAALLAVLPQAPSRYRPDRRPTSARQARDKLLDRLAQEGIWSAERVAAAKQEVVSGQHLRFPTAAPLLARRLRQAQPGQTLIRSTLSPRLQLGMESLLQQYQGRLPAQASAALLVVDVRSMDTLAYVGSVDFYSESRSGQVDMVRALRSPGSTLKPFLYGMALDEGLIHSESLLVDAPQDFGGYRPENFNQGFSGPVSASAALQRSLNLPAVQLLEAIGPARFAARLQNAGAQLVLPEGASFNLSLILGGAGSSLEDLTGLYSALANDGQADHPRLLPGQARQPRYLLSPGAAWIVRRMLEHEQAHGGPDAPLAWKTGTSYGFRDSWALGLSGDYAIGVWVGRPDGTALPGNSGAIAAAPLLFAASARLQNLGEHRSPKPMPTSVTEQEICWPLGRAQRQTPPKHCHQHRHAWILNQTVPPTLPDRGGEGWANPVVEFEVDANSGLRVDASCPGAHPQRHSAALWPRALEPWLPEPFQRRQQLPAYAPSCQHPPALSSGALSIEGVAQGALLHAAGGERELPSVHLRASGAQGRCYWFLNGALVQGHEEQSLDPTFTRPGPQQIAVVDEQGRTARLSLELLANPNAGDQASVP